MAIKEEMRKISPSSSSYAIDMPRDAARDFFIHHRKQATLRQMAAGFFSNHLSTDLTDFFKK